MPDEAEGDVTEQELQEKTYPLPDSSRVLKVSGSAIDHILIVPKGVKVESKSIPQDDSKDKELAEAKKEVEEKSKELAALKEEHSKLSEQFELLQSRLSQIEEDKKVELAKSIVESRVEKGLVSKDDAEDEITKLSKLPEEALVVMKEDTVKLAAKISEPEKGFPKATASEEQIQLSEYQKQYNEERKKLGLPPVDWGSE